MAFKLPWSNFHELNLDWVLEKMKELSDKVDDFIGSAVPSNDPPVMDGTASAGSSVNYARGDHVHPTDTSRASASDLADLSGQLDYEVGELANSINSVDAKIGFSSAAPAMDGVASPGSSADQARADHVHPTDTSRASKDEFDTLKSRVDSFSGSANPSDSVPLMDGIGSAGTGGNYSRGDHVHPSDTSKLSKAGDTMEGFLIQEKISGHFENSSIGWVRIVNVGATAGNNVDIVVTRKGATRPAETHKISFFIDTQLFDYEKSLSDEYIIDKIRYTDAGFIDIHFDQNYLSNVGVDIVPHFATSAPEIQIGSFAAVADTPAGENISAEYFFHANGTYQENITASMISGMKISIREFQSSGNSMTITCPLKRNKNYFFVVTGYSLYFNSLFSARVAPTGTVYVGQYVSSGGNTGITKSSTTDSITFTASTTTPVGLLILEY